MLLAACGQSESISASAETELQDNGCHPGEDSVENNSGGNTCVTAEYVEPEPERRIPGHVPE